MFVADLMQCEVVTLQASDTLDLADDIMRLGRIRHLPVVVGERVVGILSQRDLFRAAISSLLQPQYATEREWLARIPVHEVMTAPVVTAAPTLPVRAAVDLMLAARIGCLPVVNDGVLVGLVSETDFLRHLAHVLELAETKERLPEFRQ
jgi:CBS domain-containing protein